MCVQSQKYAIWVNLTPQLDRLCQGKAEVRILNFETTWSEFQKANQTATKKPCQTTAMRGKAELQINNLKKHRLPRVSPKQLCASAHLGCTRAAGTS